MENGERLEGVSIQRDLSDVWDKFGRVRRLKVRQLEWNRKKADCAGMTRSVVTSKFLNVTKCFERRQLVAFHERWGEISKSGSSEGVNLGRLFEGVGETIKSMLSDWECGKEVV